MTASARSSCSRATDNSPRSDSSCCDMSCTWPSMADVEGEVSSSAVARRAQPMLATATATSRINPPCRRNRREARILLLIEVVTAGRSDSTPISTAPARLLEQPDRPQLHLAIGALYHVVNRQEGHRNRGQRLHFDTRLACRTDGGLDPDSGKTIVEARPDGDVVEPQRMTQRDQLGGPLGRHRAGDLAHREDVALGYGTIRHQAEGLGRHPNRPFGGRGAQRFGLAPHVHHAGTTRAIQMRQLRHVAANPADKSVDSTAVRSCGFTFPWARSRASSTSAIASAIRPVSPPVLASRLRRSTRPSSMSVKPPLAW